MAFEKGKPKTGGRQKGKPNEVTEKGRELFVKIMEGQVPKIEKAFEALENKPKDYLDCWSKLAPYFMPKKVDITTEGKSLNPIVIDWTGDHKADSEANRGSQGTSE